jgi:hypothetical protein
VAGGRQVRGDYPVYLSSQAGVLRRKVMKKRKTVSQCKAKKPDGASCQSAALLGSDFCYFHDPAKAAERREAQALGGRQNRMKTLGTAAPDVKVKNCGDVVALLSETINQVRKGVIDPRVANAVGYLANVLIKAFEQDELETRIEKLEALLNGRSQASELATTGI